ncbi:MAG: hypothetical protein LBB21_06750 [Holosporaceae bacterium]|jgi:hypothetical protein|nr:hypothetical protein [Holosporaceae bacterium]
MKKIFGILAVLCLAFDGYAKMDVRGSIGVEVSTSSLQQNSDKPLFCGITNKSAGKCPFRIEIYQIGGNGERKNVTDDFNILFNDILIQPNATEQVKIVPCFEGSSYAKCVNFELCITNVSTGEKKTVKLTGSGSTPKVVELMKIERGNNGILRAVVAGSN